MTHYPRIAVCRVTGVKAIVRNAEEEAAFHRVPLVPMAVGMVSIFTMLCVLGWAMVVS